MVVGNSLALRQPRGTRTEASRARIGAARALADEVIA